LCPPPDTACLNYAKLLNQVLSGATYLKAWVQVPLLRAQEMHPLPSSGHEETQAKRKAPGSEQWEKWDRLRTVCQHNPNLAVALEITADLPPEAELERWLGEPVKAMFLPTSVFLTNKKGYPTLSRRHQAFIKNLYKFKAQIVLQGRPRHSGGYLPYLQYMDHLKSQLAQMTEHQRFEAPYLDYLQVPLQPLMDNLESQTYETFEKDPVKYDQYEKAVAAALGDTPEDKTSVIMVVGAGRGPLVRASLRAATQASRAVRLFAVEKNPNAVVTLRNMVVAEQWANVTVVSTDMRKWQAPELADILVSELLGSFGDNELSPECLDGAQRFLKPGGISIPYEYTSYAAPISSSKLWNEVKAYADPKKFETAFVVKMHNFYQAAEAKPCFTFTHPNPGGPGGTIDNRRYISILFDVDTSLTVHGFAGFFEAMLYKDINISIVPQTFSGEMFSWFPLYFPLDHPIFAPAGSQVEVHFWRNVSPTKVWYEWCVNKPQVSRMHNTNGHVYWIGL